MCIYYSNSENLTYNSQEHIFPAAIGGINMLPKGYVSDQANNYFSKLELLTFTKSCVSLSRDFEGPGKRGSSNAKGKHNISLMEGTLSNEKYLGYIFAGIPYVIPQIHLNTQTGETHYLRNPDDEKGFDKMFKVFDKFNGKYVNLLENKLQEKEIIIGTNDGNIFIAHNSNKNIKTEKLPDFFLGIKNEFSSKSQSSLYKYNKEQIKAQSNLIESPECSKTFAKIAINVIAYLKGKDYVCRSDFSEIKTWILDKSNSLNYKFHSLPMPSSISPKLFPPKANSCIIMNINGYLIACVCLLGYWQRNFKICNSFDNYFDVPDGYICDSVNKKEYTLIEFLYKID